MGWLAGKTSSPRSTSANQDMLDEPDLSTDRETGLSEEEAQSRQRVYGLNKIEEKRQSMVIKFLLEFVQPMPIVIWIAIAIECISVGLEYPRPAAATGIVDICCLVVLQFMNVVVGFVEELKAQKDIDELRELLNPQCTVKRSGKIRVADSSILVPGDIVCLGAGAAVPADCKLYPGANEEAKHNKPIYVDCSALTGESLPVKRGKGDLVRLSTTVVRGEAEAIVIATGANTECGKMQGLINSVEEKGHFETILDRMLIILITTGLVVNLIIIVYMAVISVAALEILSFNIVLLIGSIPIALRVVCVSTLAFGCRELAADGAIVSRMNAIEELAGMTVLCSDKTGTLTINKMQLQPECSIFHETGGGNRPLESPEGRELLFSAVLATKWWEPPRDAIDTLVWNSQKHRMDELMEHYEQVDFLPFDPSIKKTAATVQDRRTGQSFSVCKGAPNILLGMCANQEAIQNEFNMVVTDLASRGIRALAVIKNDGAIELDSEDADGSWQMIGILTFLDPCRPDTKVTVETVSSMGVGVKMITGDHFLIAKETARTLGLVGHPEHSKEPVIYKDTELPDLEMKELQTAKDLGVRYGSQIEMADGFAGVFPAQKYLIVQVLRQGGHIVGMTGDGVNDAPALKRADVGIAVMGATDAAKSASDIILTKPGLSTIATAMIASRRVFARMQNFIIYRVACTAQLLFFFMIACLFFSPNSYNKEWPSYFTTPVISLVTVTILNDGTIISVAFDNVNVGRKPQKWNLPAMFVVSASIGGVALVSSLLLLEAGLHSGSKGSMFHHLGLPALTFGQLMTMMYLKVSLSDYLSLFNARTRSWMWSRRPSYIVVVAGMFATTVATGLSLYWPFGSGMEGIPPSLAAWIWVYTIVCSLLQDLAKVGTYFVLSRLNCIDPVDEVDADLLCAQLIGAVEKGGDCNVAVQISAGVPEDSFESSPGSKDETFALLGKEV